MTLYCIYTSVDRSVALLRDACQQRGVDFVQLNPRRIDYSQPPTLTSPALLYRVVTGPRAARLERRLHYQRPTSFFATPERGTIQISNLDRYIQHHIPLPATIPEITRHRGRLRSFVDALGGFPVVLKAVGGSHGTGVMKIDSLSSLYSIVDYCLATQPQRQYYLRAFIETTTTARLIVLGDEVVGSLMYINQGGDFRSNTTHITVQTHAYGVEIEQIAVAATHALDLEFGGVDILIDDQGQAYVTEVNFPCYFPRVVEHAGQPIHLAMIDYLCRKAGV